MRKKLVIPVLAAAVTVLAIGLFSTFSSAANGTRVVKTRAVAGKTLLVDLRGMTLYSLSVERHGRFICTNSACLSVWKPLVVKAGTKPAGAKQLGTVKRPDHRIQVTYRGGPLYRFADDRKPGDMKGEGFKDVGVWHAVVVRGQAAAPAPSNPAPPPGYGGGY